MDKAQMDAKKKLNDCYFYYYSKCTKGETCQFRHEPLALGCEVTCYNWQQANCFDYQCKYRHMELKKNRKQIPCYWETQPTGCLKKHCPFLHKLGDRAEEKDRETQVVGQPVPTTGQEQVLPIHGVPVPPNAAAAAMVHPTFQRPSRRPVVMDPSKIISVPPVVLAAHQNRRTTQDPLLVNLEEESDSESTPSLTPIKKRLLDDSKRVITIKSLEQIRLERIQEEAAAFYPCYQNIPDITIKANLESFSNNENRYRVRDVKLPERYISMSLDEIHNKVFRATKRQKTESAETADFKILSLDEIRAKKRKLSEESSDNKVNMDSKVINDEALEACLKNIRENINLKPRKRRSKIINTGIPKRPKLIRNRLCPLKSEEENDEDNLLNNISDDILNSLSDEEFSESELLQENVPDVVASCVSSSLSKPSTSKYTSIKNFKLEDDEFLKSVNEFLND